MVPSKTRAGSVACYCCKRNSCDPFHTAVHSHMRRSTIGVHPEFSEAPLSRSYIYLTRKMTSAKTKLLPAMNNFMAQVYENVIFGGLIGISTSLGLQTLSFRKYFPGNVLPLCQNVLHAETEV